ncbi:MAG: hypothetical protein HZC01_01240 [Candidatus Kerfeldbacteria bacterium]|nr:hypothetical protein [Candidatus Kerfeldbacteria bacterium]
MKNITNKEDLFGWSRNAVYGAFVAFLLILGVASTAYFVGRHNVRQAQSPIAVIELSDRSPQVMGAKIFNLNGVVIENNSSDNELIIQTTYRDNTGALQQKQITVSIDPDLEIIRWDVTDTAGQTESAQRVRITLNDIQAGSQVTIQTEDDIQTNTQVNAQAITEMITPFTN